MLSNTVWDPLKVIRPTRPIPVDFTLESRCKWVHVSTKSLACTRASKLTTTNIIYLAQTRQYVSLVMSTRMSRRSHGPPGRLYDPIGVGNTGYNPENYLHHKSSVIAQKCGIFWQSTEVSLSWFYLNLDLSFILKGGLKGDPTHTGYNSGVSLSHYDPRWRYLTRIPENGTLLEINHFYQIDALKTKWWRHRHSDPWVEICLYGPRKPADDWDTPHAKSMFHLTYQHMGLWNCRYILNL